VTGLNVKGPGLDTIIHDAYVERANTNKENVLNNSKIGNREIVNAAAVPSKAFSESSFYIQNKITSAIGAIRSVGSKTDTRKRETYSMLGHLACAALAAAHCLPEAINHIPGAVGIPSCMIMNGDTTSEIAGDKMDEKYKVVISKDSLEILKAINYSPYAQSEKLKAKSFPPRAICTYPLIAQDGSHVVHVVYTFEKDIDLFSKKLTKIKTSINYSLYN